LEISCEGLTGLARCGTISPMARWEQVWVRTDDNDIGCLGVLILLALGVWLLKWLFTLFGSMFGWLFEFFSRVWELPMWDEPPYEQINYMYSLLWTLFYTLVYVFPSTIWNFFSTITEHPNLNLVLGVVMVVFYAITGVISIKYINKIPYLLWVLFTPSIIGIIWSLIILIGKLFDWIFAQ